MPSDRTSPEVRQARRQHGDRAVGRAAQAGLEDPVLQACLSVFRYLARDNAAMLESFARYVGGSMGTFLPPDKTALLLRVFLTEAAVPETIVPPEHPAQRLYMLITVREAVPQLPAEMRTGVLVEIESWSWCVELQDRATAFLGAGGGADCLQCAPWPCGEEFIGLTDLESGRLRFLHFEGHYFARHEGTANDVRILGRPWPAGHTLWLKKSDLITVGSHQLNVSTLEFFRLSAGTGKVSHLHVRDHEVILNDRAEKAVARIVDGAGSVLEVGDAGVAVPGMLLNGRAVELPVSILPGDRLSIEGLRVPVSKLLPQARDHDARHRWTIKLEDVGLVFPDGTTGIDGISLALQSGDLVGVMGPSGCGKSTLMTLLTGEISPTGGGIRFSSSLGRRPSFALVPQDDIVFPELTVLENLRYAAALRGRELTGAPDGGLRPILDSIGLANKSHLRVGSIVDKVLSGGQRKRLNIGLELTATPDGLLLDEPTSGLSSADATEIMHLLRRRADDNMLALAVIHQPSQEVFDLFDKVIILDVGGRLAFFGPPSEAIAFFQQHNPQVQAGPESILETLGGKRTTLDGGGARRIYGPDFWKRRYANVRGEYAPPLITGDFPEGTVRPAETKSPVWRNLKLIAHREFKRKIKEWRSFLASTSFSVLLALIIGWVGRSARSGEVYWYANNQNLPASLFLAVILVSFLALSASVQEVVKDNAFRLRERLLNISPVLWLLGKIPWLLLSLAFQSALVALCVFGLIGLSVAWVDLWVVLTITSWCSAALGLLVSSLPRMNERVALASVPLLQVPQLILCGADPFGFERVAHLHAPFEVPQKEEGQAEPAPWPSRFMPSRWAYQAAVTTLRDAPELEGVFEEKELVKTYNIAKKNVEMWREDGPGFFALMSEKMEAPVTEESLRERLVLVVRGGYRTPEEVAAAFGDRFPEAGSMTDDLAPLMNITFQDYAERSFGERQSFMGQDLPVVRGSLRIIFFMCGIFVVLAALSLTINRRFFGKP